MQPRLGSNEGDPVDPRSDAPAAKGGPGGPGVVAVAGEALIDFVPAGRNGLFEAAPGGSPANVAVGLARQELDDPPGCRAIKEGEDAVDRVEHLVSRDPARERVDREAELAHQLQGLRMAAQARHANHLVGPDR